MASEIGLVPNEQADTAADFVVSTWECPLCGDSFDFNEQGGIINYDE